uniref:DDT domain-containing protein n=1 Tax=Macrostomum lignano TaxID=282301 RepID=A0A1I8F6C8_9PLAT
CTSATVSSACATCDGRPSAAAPPADAPKLLSRRQLLSDPELSSNPLAERIVARHLWPYFGRLRTPTAGWLKCNSSIECWLLRGNEFLTAFELCSLLQMLVGNRSAFWNRCNQSPAAALSECGQRQA